MGNEFNVSASDRKLFVGRSIFVQKERRRRIAENLFFGRSGNDGFRLLLFARLFLGFFIPAHFFKKHGADVLASSESLVRYAAARQKKDIFVLRNVDAHFLLKCAADNRANEGAAFGCGFGKLFDPSGPEGFH